MASDQPHFQLHTDGACSGNPGPGGWAFILVDEATSQEIVQSGAEPDTTNNRMELLAVIRGLEALSEPSKEDLYSDSQYVINGITKWMDGWKAKGWNRGKSGRVLNLESWLRIDELRSIHTISGHWVRGHADHELNNRCDELAVKAIQTL